jgi:hypothetical protein
MPFWRKRILLLAFSRRPMALRAATVAWALVATIRFRIGRVTVSGRW